MSRWVFWGGFGLLKIQLIKITSKIRVIGVTPTLYYKLLRVNLFLQFNIISQVFKHKVFSNVCYINTVSELGICMLWNIIWKPIKGRLKASAVVTSKLQENDKPFYHDILVLSVFTNFNFRQYGVCTWYCQVHTVTTNINEK